MNIHTAQEFNRLLDSNSIAVQIEVYKMIIDSAILISAKNNGNYDTPMNRDAAMLFEMTAMKGISILELAKKKIVYQNSIENFQMQIYDPFGVQPIVRSQFEAFGHFNNLYIQSASESEINLKYDLWVMCGLMNRQKYSPTSNTNINKLAKEKVEIQDLKNSIETNPFFKSLDDKYQKLIFAKAKQSDWKLTISNNKILFVGWQQLAQTSLKKETLKNLYRNFSLSAHPSNVSVFQYRSAYEPGNEMADSFTHMAVRLSKYFLSFLIADYCTFSSSARDVFNSLPEIHQILINSYNRMFRIEEIQINDIWTHFGPILDEAFQKGLIKIN